MISHFWNLCRSCPNADLEKLHSEYRSTFKWHALTAKAQQQFQHQQPEHVIRKPPQPCIEDFPFMRKKKHPEIAYKSHELFDPSLAPSAFPSRNEVQQLRPRPKQRGTPGVQRRAQSEGPGVRNPLFRQEGGGIEFGVTVREDSMLQAQRTTHSHLKDVVIQAALQNGLSPSVSGSASGVANSKKSSHQAQMKESVSMGHILISGADQALNPNTKAVSSMGMNQSAADEAPTSSKQRKEYRTEYRKNFRPFSQYEFVDGRFVPNVTVESANKAASLHGEPWYQEVVELRRRAQDYKCRGWGTEMMPSQVSDLYQKQMHLCEQAARRESLSALSLAISSPRCTSDKREKTIIDSRISPTKYVQLRPSRPRTAPPTRGPGSSAKSSRSESAHPVSDTAAIFKGPRDQLDGGGLRKAVIIPNRAKSPVKSGHSRPASALTLCSSVAPSPGPWASSSEAKEASIQPVRMKRQRPTEKDGPSQQRRPFSRSSSKTGAIVGSRDASRPPSAFENHVDYFKEPVVKSPLEPTRVKSPESMIRSPDPINWTVPLDTGKTFSVTQSIRDGDSNRNSPMSDHSSSLFDSVSGTAISLGRGSFHHHHHPTRISTLAKEAREFQPGLTKDSTMTRPEPNKPCDPNPSIPEAVEESSSKSVTTNGSTKHVNGDNGLKCLEDPSFEFENGSGKKDSPKKPSYRVLEDPFESDMQGERPVKKSPYKVLDDLMVASVYEASTCGEECSESALPVVAAATSPTPVANRVLATEVLEGARERFDKFWGKNKDMQKS